MSNQVVHIDQREVDESMSCVTLYQNAVEESVAETVWNQIQETPNEEWIECRQPIPKANVEQKLLRRCLWGAPEGQDISILNKKRAPLKSLHSSLVDLQKNLAETYKVNLDAYLVQEFQDGDQYLGFRSDSEACLGTDFSTVMVTLGAPRKVIFKEWTDSQREKDCLRRGIPFVPSAGKRKFKTVEFTLEPRSVLVISGSTQRFWSHSIEKNPEVKDKTLVVTFRPHNPELKFKRVTKPKVAKVPKPDKKAKTFEEDEDEEKPKKRKRAAKEPSQKKTGEKKKRQPKASKKIKMPSLELVDGSE